jgi:hypothetical protein
MFRTVSRYSPASSHAIYSILHFSFRQAFHPIDAATPMKLVNVFLSSFISGR